MNLTGKIIGNRYEILEVIGNGGMATVYKAKCHVLNRFVAVKVLKDEFTTDDEFIRRFNTEAQAAASLTHPNIVSIYDVGQENNLYYIVMELVQGKTLKEIINEDGVLPWKWSVNIAIQIASALEMAHKNNIVHRDIKPHNIIITEDGIAKVTDFGIAKAVSNSTITAFGTTIGSVHYFSPEHARGGYTDAKSDLYSLGVVMYEMLTGRVPFDADTAVSVALKHMQEKAVEPVKLNPSIPFAVNQIIMRAMQKETNLRYQSATEMLRDLSKALKDPEGDFVKESSEDGFTRRIPTITEEDLQRAERNTGNKKKKKKQGKLKTYFAEHPKMKIVAILLSCIFVFVLSFVIMYFAIELTSPKNVNIPNLVGMTQEEAQETLKKLKVNYELEKEEFNSEVEAGKIISQDPPFIDNYKILEKSTIKVVVSKGTEIVKVPKVAGKTFEEAEEELRKSNLQVEKIEEKSKTIEEGIVIKQDPKEETEAKAGDTIKVYVSIGTGIKQVTVPAVLNDTEAAAKKTLTEAGLEVIVVNEEDTSKDNGKVIKQSIEAGKTVDEGTKITITVNKIEELKKGTVIVNVKSITGGIPKPTANEVVSEDEKKAQVKVTVGEDTIYNEKVSKDKENISLTVEGKGTLQVKVYINGVLKRQTQLNLNDTNPKWIAE